MRAMQNGRATQNKACQRAEHVIVGDLSDSDETKNVAYEANAWGQFDAVIHNAGVYQAPARQIFTVNILAPYLLTCLIAKTQALDLPEFRPASARACQPGQLPRRQPPHELFGFKAVRDDAVHGRCTQMAGCVRQRRRSRLGPHENGWIRRTR